MANRWRNSGNSDRLYFGGLQKSLQMVTAAMKLKDTYSLEKSYDQPRQHIKKQRYYFVNKGPFSQCYGFSSSHVCMRVLDYKESWGLKNWCFWTVWCWRRLLRVTWIARRSTQCILNEINPGLFIERSNAKAETPILWPPDEKSWLIWKDPDAGKDWGQEDKGTTEHEMTGWHHWLNEHEFGWTPGVGDGQGGLVCCGSWVCRVGHNCTTELTDMG